MSTSAQIHANRVNAQHSTAPKTAECKASRNNFQWGFCGRFSVLPSESPEEFDALKAALHNEHQPATPTETLLVDRVAEHHWLSRRALTLQDAALAEGEEKRFALYLRYQTTNDRAFHRGLNDLLRLRAEKRKQEIGFESQRLETPEHRATVTPQRILAVENAA